MTIKRAITALLSVTMALGCSTISVMADVNNVDSINVPIIVDSSATNTVTGYIAEITYNPEALVPVLNDADVLGEDCYAINNINRGYLTADKIQDGTIIVGWADKEHYSLENGNVMANINFDVLPDAKYDFRNSEGEFTSVDTKIYQVARYPDIMLDTEFDYSENYKLNDNYAISYIHNFTSDGLSDNYFNITGNLSTIKGSIEYNGLTLTQCLKIETNTNIKFNGAGVLTLVFGQANSNIIIDGTEYVADENGVLTVDLVNGSHIITKSDVANLYYMSLDACARDLEISIDTAVNTNIDADADININEISDEIENSDINDSVVITDVEDNVIENFTVVDLPGVPVPPELDTTPSDEEESTSIDSTDDNISLLEEIASTVIIE